MRTRETIEKIDILRLTNKSKDMAISVALEKINEIIDLLKNNQNER